MGSSTHLPSSREIGEASTNITFSSKETTEESVQRRGHQGGGWGQGLEVQGDERRGKALCSTPHRTAAAPLFTKHCNRNVSPWTHQSTATNGEGERSEYFLKEKGRHSRQAERIAASLASDAENLRIIREWAEIPTWASLIGLPRV
jgi:hypothetical protein